MLLPYRRHGQISPPPLAFLPRRLNAGILLILGTLFFLAPPAQAQFIGDRIRITTEGGEKIIGEIQGYDASSLALLANSAEQKISYADMARLERSLGVRSYARKGARWGFWAGAALGSLGLINQVPDTGDGLLVFAFFSLGGSMTGFALSAPFRGERWERLDIAGQDSASTLPIMGVHATLSEDRMRITTRNEGTITGRLQGYDAHSLTLHVDSTEHIISYADMLSLKRSQGFRRYPIQGAWTGLGVGTVATLVVFPPPMGGHRVRIDGNYFYRQRHRAGLAHRDTERKMGALDIPGQESGLSVAPVFGVTPHPGQADISITQGTQTVAMFSIDATMKRQADTPAPRSALLSGAACAGAIHRGPHSDNHRRRRKNHWGNAGVRRLVPGAPCRFCGANHLVCRHGATTPEPGGPLICQKRRSLGLGDGRRGWPVPNTG